MKSICRSPLLVALVLVVASFAQAKDGPYTADVETDVMIPMRDGVKLATDIYYPAQGDKRFEGKLPVVLTRSPYNKSGAKSYGNYFASHGYVFIAQDTRGRYGSEGVWHMMTDDGPDGLDTARWIVAQPWSDGKIGMVGTSYVGGTQHALAMMPDSPITTVIPVDAVSNPGVQSMRNAGAFELRFWNWIYLNAGKGSRASHDPGTKEVLEQMSKDRKLYLANLPLRAGLTPLRLAPEYEAWLVAAMREGRNNEFWSQNNIVDHADQYQDMPVYLVGGWYDSWAGNTTANYRALSPKLKGPVYLIMGPWIHGAQGKSEHGQVSFGPDAAIDDELGWRRAWMDRWLKGQQNGFGTSDPFKTPVRIFVMGTGDGTKTKTGKLNHGGYWRNELEWPLKRTKYTNFYLHAGGQLVTEAPSSAGESTSYEFDPRNPVPTIGGNISSGNDILLQGAWDQRGGEHVWNSPEPLPLSARNDIVVFQSPPLEADLEVTGEIEVKLWISSSAVDTDFTAKLIDVYPSNEDFPDGFDLNIGDGILRARFRESLQEEKLMQPGVIYPITIRLYPTSNVFKRGHRLRLDVSSSNFPRFDVNPNTGEPLNDNRRVVTAVNTVHHDREHPSHIVLPVVPK
jgi:putative CocE/NonD family hydrolase